MFNVEIKILKDIFFPIVINHNPEDTIWVSFCYNLFLGAYVNPTCPSISHESRNLFWMNIFPVIFPIYKLCSIVCIFIPLFSLSFSSSYLFLFLFSTLISLSRCFSFSLCLIHHWKCPGSKPVIIRPLAGVKARKLHN